jgi:ribonuclease HII
MSPRTKFDRSLIPDRPDLTFESALWQSGFRFIAGIDEAGRGALAGPVSAGAVVLPSNIPDLWDRLQGVRDSKELTPKERDFWAEKIKAIALAWGVGFASCGEIDRIGIVPATHLAASRALSQLQVQADHLLLDYLVLPDNEIPQTSLIKGDARSLSIASASILAKTARDAVLVEMEDAFPGYHFASNKGYATQAHRTAIAELGPCEQHRRSFCTLLEYDSLFPTQNH